VSSGSPFELQVGFCRAVRVGDIIAVSGTAPLSADGVTIGTGDVAAQARRCFEIIADALARLGADISDVVRTRVFLTRIDDWKQVAEVHGEFFRDIRPAATFVQVTSFIDSDWLVEIEADAVIRQLAPMKNVPIQGVRDGYRSDALIWQMSRSCKRTNSSNLTHSATTTSFLTRMLFLFV
jgi:enamine deaminase RidA (YjgF/YER057c/UK114 family)